MSRTGYLFKHIGTGLLAGALIGSITGLLEVLFSVLDAGNSVVSRTFLLHAVLIYGMGWAFSLTVFAVIAALFTTRNRKAWDPPRITACYTSLAICLSILVVGGGYVNLHCLPAANDPKSLLFDLALVLFCTCLFLVLYRMGRRAFRFRTEKKAFRRLRTLSLSGLTFLLVASAAISYFPERKETVRLSEKKGDKAQSVVLIVIDTLRADHLSLYGYQRETDPNLKTFARNEGITFLQAGSQASWTKPSVATILTSLYLPSHKANALGAVLPDSVNTLSEILHDHGFRTGFFSANEWISPLFNFDQGVDHFYVNTSSKIDNLIAGHVLDLVGRFSPIVRNVYLWIIKFDRFLQTGNFNKTDNIAPIITKRALEWIEENKDDSVFAYIHYIDPHAPYTPPQSLRYPL